MAFPFPQTTNLYKLKSAADNAYGAQGRSSATYTSGNGLGVINAAIQKVCEDYTEFTAKTFTLAATTVGVNTITPPTDIWMPQIFTAEWKPDVTVNPYGTIEVISKAAMDMAYPNWRRFEVNSYPTTIVIDWIQGLWYWYPTPSTAGMIAQITYPAKPTLFTGVAGEDASNSTTYINVPDIFVERTIALEVARRWALPNFPKEAQALAQQYEMEKVNVGEALFPYFNQPAYPNEGPASLRLKAIRL